MERFTTFEEIEEGLYIMKTILLCGGKGFRFLNTSLDLPKVLAPIGDKPILVHIMDYYARYGFNEFILCLGEHGTQIQRSIENEVDYSVTFLDTGLDTATGGRILMAKEAIKEDETFFVNYGDALGNVDLNALYKHHIESDVLATLTTYKPRSQYGVLRTDGKGRVISFTEKPMVNDWINAGFFVFNKAIFDCINPSENIEYSLFENLLKTKNLAAYKHSGFWKSMDTFKENQELNDIWKQGKAPWS
ncbi:MAG: hypothetical protein CBE00_07155 [Planctomycetaceae bacterium TMED240]|nr:MAG: hypothetical protein CBE00_07155 [Planctomycetaceae bacterium TMED240]